MNKYIAFRCMGCGLIHVIDKTYSDGHRCRECKGALLVLDRAVIVSCNKKISNIGIDIDVNISQLDKALEKVETLKKDLDKINTLMESWNGERV